MAVGVGFLLNSNSSVANWSCVARCLFRFFCCWVKVLFREGLRCADELLAEFDAVGDGVEDILIAASSCASSAMSGFVSWAMFPHAELGSSKSASVRECSLLFA